MAWTDGERARAFWLLCLPLRTLIAVLAWATPPGSTERYAVAALLLYLGASQLYLYVTGGRMDAAEGGGVTWWAPARALFGAVFIAAAAVAYRGPTDDWRFLPLADPLLGAAVWLALRPESAGPDADVDPGP